MRAAAPLALAFLLSASSALAADANCPPGSFEKTENGLTWCQATVCNADTDCKTGEACRVYPLCVEVGKTDGGDKIMVRQKCGLEKACPQMTSCSEFKRCISRAEADKLAPAPAASTPSQDAPKKSMCSASVPGTPTSPWLGLALAGAIAVTAASRSARRKR